MNEDTQIVTKTETEVKTEVKTDGKPKRDHSHIFNVSLRGWITFMITGTICYMGLSQIQVEEPLYTLSCSVISFYFGQMVGKNGQKQS